MYGVSPTLFSTFIKKVPLLARSCNTIKPIIMSYDVFGENNTNKTPLVIMHGLFGSKRNWQGISRALEKKINRKIFTVDARNHGESPHTSEHSSAHMAADVADFIRQQGYSKTCVMGHSMGGRAMMYLALNFPNLVERGIIIDISPISIPRSFSQMDQIMLAMKNLSISPDLSTPEARKIVEVHLKNVVEDYHTVNFIMMNLRKRKSGEFYWAPNIEALHRNLRGFSEFMEHVIHLDPFKGPMLFACGSRSSFMNVEHWPEIQRIFPNSKLHWLDAGHLVHFDQPAKFMDIVEKFLKND